MNTASFTNIILDILNNNGISFNQLKKLYYIAINTQQIDLAIKYEKDLQGFEFITVSYILFENKEGLSNEKKTPPLPDSDILKFKIARKSRIWKIVSNRSFEYIQNLTRKLRSMNIRSKNLIRSEKLY